MEHRIRLGIEASTGANPWIPARASDSHIYTEDIPTVDNLYRYSFVYEADDHEAENLIVHSLVSQVENPQWVSTWCRLKPKEADARSHAITSQWVKQITNQRLAQGWRLCVSQDEAQSAYPLLHIAGLAASNTNIEGFAPGNYASAATRTRIILVFGNYGNLCETIRNNLFEEIAFMATHGSFAPSEKLLLWLRDSNIGLAYPVQTSSERTGLVVLYADPLSFEHLANVLDVETRTGTAAQTIWE